MLRKIAVLEKKIVLKIKNWFWVQKYGLNLELVLKPVSKPVLRLRIGLWFNKIDSELVLETSFKLFHVNFKDQTGFVEKYSLVFKNQDVLMVWFGFGLVLPILQTIPSRHQPIMQDWVPPIKTCNWMYMRSRFLI